MNDTVYTALSSTKNFVVKHKTKIAVAATAVTCLAVNRSSLAQHNELLKEHGLYDAFYTPENSY